MRLWSLHPRLLDPTGLVACWREALLARAVLRGKTRGYRNHPQLDRFKAHVNPVGAINAYLASLHAEATYRGYDFDASKFRGPRARNTIAVNRGQLKFEWRHLDAKLARRNPTWRASLGRKPRITAHPLFRVKPGRVESWERG